MEQTKFTSKAQKLQAKFMVANAVADGVLFFSFPENGVTVALKREGPEMIKFAVSIASPEETKFRKLVGKERALARLDFDGGQPAVVLRDMELCFASDLADLIG